MIARTRRIDHIDLAAARTQRLGLGACPAIAIQRWTATDHRPPSRWHSTSPCTANRQDHAISLRRPGAGRAGTPGFHSPACWGKDYSWL